MTISGQARRCVEAQDEASGQHRRRTGPARTRLAAVVAASALGIPFAPVDAGPATAASAPHAVDYRGPGGYGSGYKTYGGWYPAPFTMPYGGTGSGSVGTPSSTETTRSATAAESTGLVEITSRLNFGSGEAAGTGMVIGSNGLVVTNHHVIADSTKLVATVVSTGKTYRVRVLGYDASKDVALVRLVGARGLTTVSTADTAPKVGDPVVSVGDAGGDGGTLTASPGAVTAVRRSLTVSDDDGRSSRLRNEIEVAADVIAGDSGGALYDTAGKVIGMNVAASTGTADVTGYAIPIGRVERVVAQVLNSDAGSVTLGYPGFLGVELSSNSTSPTVTAVAKGSAAVAAGLTAGDRIISVAGTSTPTVVALKRVVANHRAGDSVVVSWTSSDASSHTARVVLHRGPIG